MQFVKTDGDNDPHSNVAIGYFARGASTNGAWGGASSKNNYGHENVIGFEVKVVKMRMKM